MNAPAGPYARIALQSDRDVALARSMVGKAMDSINARALRKTRFVTAVSEIARNAVVHGGGGEILVFVDGAPATVRIECRDRGPGIADLARAFADGFTTGSGMGLGLGGARRLVDRFEIDTSPGKGVTVRMSAQR